VSINEPYGAFWGSIDAPMGGMGWSGLGRRHGREGLLKYTDAQTVGVQRLAPFAPMLGLDQRRFAQVMSAAVGLLDRLGRP
jgi:succinate-semialdehyde dehydrogenase/glutarate-semialdehyde dehydrogenase